MSASVTERGRLWVIIPAAGSGSRFQGLKPKQYEMLGTRTVLHATMDRFLATFPDCEICVGISAVDDYWSQEPLSKHGRVRTSLGGAQRADTVLAALECLSADAQASDWVMVHDAARPCVTKADLKHLRARASEHSVGGLLVAPVVDTLKRGDQHQQVANTEERKGLYHALTPQMFPYEVLKEALAAALEDQAAITDESSAIEALGLKPLLVEGRRSNIKITYPEDLALAKAIIQSQLEPSL